MDYKIYYGDGSTFDGDADNVKIAPAGWPSFGVQYIIGNDPAKGNQSTGLLTVYNVDIYIYSSDIGWHGTDKYHDLMTHLEHGKVIRVLAGLWIPRPRFLEIQNRALNDPDFNRKSAIDPARENLAS